MSATFPTTTPPSPISRDGLLASLAALSATWMVIMASRCFALQAADVNGGLGVGVDSGSWLSTAYAVCEPIGVVLGSWLGMALAPRRMLLAGVAAFLLGMSLPLLAPTFHTMMASRIVTGLAAGVITPQCIVIQLQCWRPPRTPVAIALFLSGPTASLHLGGMLGAWGVGHFGWTFILWVWWPLGALALVACWLGGRREPVAWRPLVHADVGGILSISACIGFFVCAVTQGDRLRWFQAPAIPTLFAASAACLAIFLVRDWDRIRHPVLWVRMLRRWNIGITALAVPALLLAIGLSATFIPSILAQVQDFRPEQTAAALWAVAWPQAIAYPACLFILFHRLVEPRLMAILGFATVALGATLDLRLTSQWQAGEFQLGQMIQGLGLPLIGMPLIYLFTGELRPPREAFPAAGLLNLSRVLGGTIATAWATTALRLDSQGKFSELATNTAFYAFGQGDTLSRIAGRLASATSDPAKARLQAAQILVGAARRQAAVLGAVEAMTTLAWLLLLAGMLLVAMRAYGSGRAPRPDETAP